MRLGDSKKIQDIIFTVQKGGISGSGTSGDPWQTTTGPGETQTVTAPTGGQGQGSTTTGVPFLKLEVSSTSENNSNEAVFSVNGQERFRSTTGGGFSSRIELGDSISFSTEGGESTSFAWSFYIEPDQSSSSSSSSSVSYDCVDDSWVPKWNTSYYLGDKFVVAGRNSKHILVSDDGNQWNRKEILGHGQIWESHGEIAYNSSIGWIAAPSYFFTGEEYLAPEYPSSGPTNSVIIISPDTNSVRRSILPSSGLSTWNHIAISDIGTVILFGEGLKAAISTNAGDSWQTIQIPNPIPDMNDYGLGGGNILWGGVAWGNGKFIAVFSRYSTTTGTHKTIGVQSSSGSNWSSITTMPFDFTPFDIKFSSDNKFVMLGVTTAAPSITKVYTSIDGSSWIEGDILQDYYNKVYNSVDLTSGFVGSIVALGPDKYISVRAEVSGLVRNHNLSESTDRTNWSAINQPVDAAIPSPCGNSSSSSSTPVPQPTDTPVPQPTDTPVPQPTDTPVPQPTDTPVPQPTDTPVPQPTDTPVPQPTDTPVPTRTARPTQTPTSTPTQTPTSTETPVPTSTPTPTPTPSAVDYDTTITVPSDSNKINGNGVTLVSNVGSSVSYNNLIDFAGTPFNILVYISNVQVALITITNPYIGKPFRFTTNSGDSYEATFEMDGRIDF